MVAHKFLGFLAAAAVASASQFTVIATARADQKDDIHQAYIESFGVRPGSTMLDNLARVFQELDLDGKGITADSISFVEQMQTAEKRGIFAGDWLRGDLNGDLKVSRQEIQAVTARRNSGRFNGTMTDLQKQRMAAEITKQVDKILVADTDGNGVIEGTELFTPPRQRDQTRPEELGPVHFAKAMLKADPNKDGVLTQIEASQLAAQNLEGIDAEIIRHLEKLEGNRALGMSPDCPMIEVSKDSQLLLFGAYEGTSLSAVSIAGQDEVTNGATVLIEDGTQPLTIFLSSYRPMIWQFAGATQRVRKVVAIGGNAQGGQDAKPAVGVVGLEKSKVQFVRAYACFGSFHEAGSKDGLKAQAIVERMTDRAPDKVLGQYGVAVASLPSGEGLTQSDEQQGEVLNTLIAKSGAKFFTVGPDGKLLALDTIANRSSAGSGLLRFNTHGLMNFNVKEVVSEAKVEPYNVYPEHAGLMQLEAQGKITRASNKWRINGPMHFPPGLAGALSTCYLLPKGIPMPEGSLGHSRVFVEDASGKITGDGNCR